MIRIKDIAELAGTSLSAVSFVLNGKGTAMRISEKTQERILEAAQKLGYVANVQARRLKSADYTPLIALYWPIDTLGFSLDTIMEGLTKSFHRESGDVEIVARPYKPGKLSATGIEKAENKYNALLFAEIQEADFSYIEQLNLKLPICYIGSPSGKNVSMLPDYINAGKEVARLFAAYKLSHVAFVGWKGEGSYLLNGFSKGCGEYGLQFAANDVFQHPSSPLGGARAAEDILLRDEIPQAILFESDKAVIGAMGVFQKRGLRIPENLKIVACGNNPLLEYLPPSITALTFPMRVMVEDALLAAVAAIGGKRRQSSKLYAPEFIFRESCGAFPGKKAYRIFI